MEKEYEVIEPDIWKPTKEGDTIEGVYLDKEERMIYKEVSNLYSLETPEGTLKKVWGSKILDDRMKLVNLGQELRITFKGEKQNKAGTKFKMWIVEVAKSQKKP